MMLGKSEDTMILKRDGKLWRQRERPREGVRHTERERERDRERERER